MRRPHPNRRAGFSLLELTIATMIFLVVGLALKDTVLMADRSQSAVFEGAKTNRELRAASRRLARELRSARGSLLTVETLPNGCAQATFMTPIVVGGNDDWGVEDDFLTGGQPQADWSLRYTVVDDGDRRLIRQVLDDAQVVQDQQVVLAGLSTDPNTPGFTLAQTGDVWEVALVLDGQGDDDETGKQLDFHLRMRN